MSSSTLFRVLVFLSVLLIGLAVLFAPAVEEPTPGGWNTHAVMPQR